MAKTQLVYTLFQWNKSDVSPSDRSEIPAIWALQARLAARELRKAGVRIKLQDQPFQILALLLERPGEVVTREDLQKRLWPEDTFVDFDLSLNSAIKKLRQTLGDDSENPRFVETLYRRGYRFIAPVSGHVSPEIVAVPAPTLRGLEPVKATAEPRREMFWRTFPWPPSHAAHSRDSPFIFVETCTAFSGHWIHPTYA